MRYLVHIGYPKAASTWLQSTILGGTDNRIQPLARSFVKNGACKSGGDFFYDSRTDLERDRKNLTRDVTPFAPFDACRVRLEIESRLNPHAELTCLSNEAWAGHPYSGGVHGKIYLERIHTVLPQAKILIIVRNPVTSIVSAYADFMDRAIGVCGFHDFLSPRKSTQIPNFSIHYYSYIELIEAYDRLFGRDNVVVVPLELLLRSVKDFIAPLYSSLDLPLPANIPVDLKRNTRDYRKLALLGLAPAINWLGPKRSANGNGALDWARLFGAFRKAYYFMPYGFASKYKKHLQDQIIERYGEYLCRSNELLGKRLGMELGDLGYLTHKTCVFRGPLK